ncbi:MAG TPA: competence/damage-inducible protein A, partial [Crenotrichaceae bacterium]|nr:competence/damage-inducible protein A [Crenotrichaceae bacterium]
MKTFNAEIISQGEEVITGQIVDTNAAWLSERLTRLGFQITRHITVGDRLDDLITTFVEVTKRADVCICTGGLGPTSDDLTSQAVATAFNRPLHEDKIALQKIQQYFTQRQKTMAVINRKQALMPEGARRLDNHWGTAPGFVLRENDCQLFCVPGVPYEMRQLFEHQIEPLLIVDYEQQASQLVTIRTV